MHWPYVLSDVVRPSIDRRDANGGSGRVGGCARRTTIHVALTRALRARPPEVAAYLPAYLAVIQLVVRSNVEESIEDAARDGPYAHGHGKFSCSETAACVCDLSDVFRLSFGANRLIKIAGGCARRTNIWYKHGKHLELGKC